ncbi:MAG TPA: NAD(P)H-dependent oxidoreductase [Candidatus Saccharimonadales bacterium]|nr:NAD(P)H-dependent oxidoreductase [Candidatus Saccharimonadales bacterium]
MSLVKIIVASTRPGRFGIQPANWLMELAKEHPETTFELVDLKKIDLPFLDEETPALYAKYANAHTKAWAKAIGEADGFIIVTAEYNHSYPAPLKNAIDFLAKEWYYKPVAYVGYGAEAGGARAVEHLRSLGATVALFDLRESLIIPNYWTQLDEQGAFQPNEAQTKAAHDILTKIGFWSEELKTPRAKLEKTGK